MSFLHIQTAGMLPSALVPPVAGFDLHFKLHFSRFNCITQSPFDLLRGYFDQQASVHFVSDAWVSIKKAFRNEEDLYLCPTVN